jgi:hypothetical protein
MKIRFLVSISQQTITTSKEQGHFLTPWTSPELCMRKLHMVLSRHSPRDWMISTNSRVGCFFPVLYDTYGAMITREPGTGKEPIPSISLGT